MEEMLREIQGIALREIGAAEASAKLEEIRVRVLGKKGELTALLRSANLYLGSDTGPMHLAAAVGTRCVGLFGSTRPEDSGPYGEGHICLQAWYQSGTCRKRRKASNDAMRAITVEETCRACERILLRNTSSAA